MLIAPENLGIQDITACVTQTEASFLNPDSGGTANVYRGVYVRPNDHVTIEVVIKSARVNDLESRSEKIRQRTQKNLLRELAVWNALQRNLHKNILPLFGVAYIPSSRWLCSISEYCQQSLEAYFKEPPEKPDYIRFMREILQGLAHMHSLNPPIAHGDLKLTNVLLGFDGVVKLCDFGQSRFQNDQRGLASDATTTFESTHRFMSPELFKTSQKVRPTDLSDVWAYGCVALQLLSRLKPYHTVKSDYIVPRVITSGQSPSTKPEKPHAPRCLNEHLWSIIEWCWSPLVYRPTTARLLEELNRLIEQKLVDLTPLTPDRMSFDFDGDLPDWPNGIIDFAGAKPASKAIMNTGTRAEIWVCQEQETQDTTEGSDNDATPRPAKYIVKIPIPPKILYPEDSRLDAFQYLLRKIVRERYSLQHQNVLEMIGIDTSFKMCTGLVFEFCENSSLEIYKTQHLADQYALLRYMIQILEGLRYLHTFPTPIAHGDLNPANILVDGKGTLKLTLFSLSRIALNIPEEEPSGGLADRVETVRYLSPEILDEETSPSVWSDMWAFGCVVFWLCSNLHPYHETKRESDVERLIQRGAQPYDAQALREESGEGNQFTQSSTNTWLTNGISDWGERCWNTKSGPSAAEFLKFLQEMPSEMEASDDAWALGVTNLSGSVIRPTKLWEHGGGLSGVWRYSRTSLHKPAQDATQVEMKWTKASFRRGIFRLQTQALAKFTMHGRSRRGSGHYVASQLAIKHEIYILGQLRHPNICSLWGYEEDVFGAPGLPAIVTEFSSNGTLRQYLARFSEELDTSKKLLLVESMLKGVNYLHEQVVKGPVVHGNLNMESVVVNTYGAAKLRNFEFSFQYMRDERPGVVAKVIRSAALVPNPSRWHPPEMFAEVRGFNNNWPIPTRSMDLWATGCLLLAVFSETEPYSGTDIPAVFTRITNKEIPYTREACSHKEVWSTAEQLWGRNAADRISAAEALERVARFI